MEGNVDTLSIILDGVNLTLKFQYTLFAFVFLHKPYLEIDSWPADKWARVQVYSLSLIFRMWSHPHYRSASFQQDMIDNLSNVAVPGTGIPLSWFCYHWISGKFLFFVCYHLFGNTLMPRSLFLRLSP